MVHALDESVGRIMSTLEEEGMLQNSVVIFGSDNGAITSGIHANFGSNWPLKGVSSYEGRGGGRVGACKLRASELIKRAESNHSGDFEEDIYNRNWLEGEKANKVILQ